MDEFSICLHYLLNLIAVLCNRAPIWLKSKSAKSAGKGKYETPDINFLDSLYVARH